jgi:hypothetical protein
MTQQHEPETVLGELGSSPVHRRTALKAAVGGAVAAAALGAPELSRLGAAPAYGQVASGCELVTIGGWSHSHYPASWQEDSGLHGYYPTPADQYAGMPPVHLVEEDPPPGTYPNPDGVTGTSTYTSGAFTLTPGHTYTFAFSYRLRDHSTHVARQRLDVQWATSPTGPWTTGFNVTTTLGTGTRDNVTNGSGTITIDAQAPGTYYIRYLHSFIGTVTSDSNQRANDIAVTIAENVGCVPT